MDAPAHGNDQKGAEKVGGDTVAASSNMASNPSSLSAECSLAPEKSEPLSVASLGDVKIPIFQSRESTCEDGDFTSDLGRIALDHDTEPIDENAPTEFSIMKKNLSMPPIGSPKMVPLSAQLQSSNNGSSSGPTTPNGTRIKSFSLGWGIGSSSSGPSRADSVINANGEVEGALDDADEQGPLPAHTGAVMEIISLILKDTMFTHAEYWIMSAKANQKTDSISVDASTPARAKAGAGPRRAKTEMVNGQEAALNSHATSVSHNTQSTPEIAISIDEFKRRDQGEPHAMRHHHHHHQHGHGPPIQKPNLPRAQSDPLFSFTEINCRSPCVANHFGFPRQSYEAPTLFRKESTAGAGDLETAITTKPKKGIFSFNFNKEKSLDLRDKESKSSKKDDENSEWRLTYYSSSTDERFLSEAQNPASYIHSKCPDVKKQLGLMKAAARKHTLMPGQGLAGICWLKRTFHWCNLRALINDPSYRVDMRIAAADPLFAGALSIPVYDVIRTNRLVAVVTFYLPHMSDMSPSRVISYLDGSLNPKLHPYMEQASIALRTAMRWETGWSELGYVRRAFLEDRGQKVKRAWAKIRNLVRTGWVRRSQSAKATDEGTTSPLLKIQRYVTGFTYKYLRKLRGQKSPLPPGNHWKFSLMTSVCGFLAMSTLAGIQYQMKRSTWKEYADGSVDLNPEFTILIASFAAVVTTIFTAPASPFSQPRIIIVTHLFGSTVAVIMDYFTNPKFSIAFLPQWLSSALTVSIVMYFMAITGYIHPPAAACSLIFISGTEKIKQIGWLYLGMPVIAGTCLLCALGMIMNNFAPDRKYPLFW